MLQINTTVASNRLANPKAHILGIDLLRFFAAVLVASLHLWGSQAHGIGGFIGHLTSFVLPGSNELSPHALPPIAFVGSIGVQIFFVISGYVISYSAQASTGFYKFLYGRTMRLLPGLWIVTILTACIALASGFYTPSEALIRTIRSFVLFPIGAKVDDVVWTLNLEIVFYSYVAILILRNSSQKIPQLAFMLGAISLLYWSTYFLFGCTFNEIKACEFFRNPYSYKVTSLLLIQHGGFFAFGMFLWATTANGFRPIYVVGILTSSIASILQLIWTSNYYFQQDEAFGAPSNSSVVLIIWMVAMFFMSTSVIYNEVIYRTLRAHASFIRIIGLATYPLYLCHGFVGGFVVAVMIKLGVTGLLAFTPALIISTCVAIWIAAQLEPALRTGINKVATALRVYPSVESPAS
jgi:exopolysaccharide production protein ExoZ